MKQDLPWTKAGIEPNLADLLADPIMHAVMMVDRITADDVIEMICDVRLRLDATKLIDGQVCRFGYRASLSASACS